MQPSTSQVKKTPFEIQFEYHQHENTKDRVKVVVKASKKNQDFKDHLQVKIKTSTIVPMSQICPPNASEEEKVDRMEHVVRGILDAVKNQLSNEKILINQNVPVRVFHDHPEKRHFIHADHIF